MLNNHLLTTSCVSADSSAAPLCSPPKRGALRRQACLEQNSQEQILDPWIRHPDSPPELDSTRHAAGSTQPNTHCKASTMSDQENAELNGTAADDDMTGTAPESKKAPPVAPKPSWFRQSLRKIRDEQDQKKLCKPAASSSRSFGTRGAAPAANRSIKQKIYSFENFSGPEGPEKKPDRRPAASSTTLMEKEPQNQLASERETQCAPVREAEHAISTSPPSEACSPTAKSCDEPPFIQPQPSDPTSTDPAPGSSVLPSQLSGPELRADISESEVLPPTAPVRSSPDGEDGLDEGPEGSAAQNQEKLSAAQATDRSLGRILSFSNQVNGSWFITSRQVGSKRRIQFLTETQSRPQPAESSWCSSSLILWPCRGSRFFR